ncbi:unnamed protein product [Caenorhabditis sp. 36 PRJEB53466]|nr:unnamed protein product [Caenorhabditis sp. 36 PRJEB53466]
MNRQGRRAKSSSPSPSPSPSASPSTKRRPSSSPSLSPSSSPSTKRRPSSSPSPSPSPSPSSKRRTTTPRTSTPSPNPASPSSSPSSVSPVIKKDASLESTTLITPKFVVAEYFRNDPRNYNPRKQYTAKDKQALSSDGVLLWQADAEEECGRSKSGKHRMLVGPSPPTISASTTDSKSVSKSESDIKLMNEAHPTLTSSEALLYKTALNEGSAPACLDAFNAAEDVLRSSEAFRKQMEKNVANPVKPTLKWILPKTTVLSVYDKKQLPSTANFFEKKQFVVGVKNPRNPDNIKKMKSATDQSEKKE